jgi:hypothetical protein
VTFALALPPKPLAATALALAGALALTACGGSNDSAGDKITGAPSAPASVSAAASATATTAATPAGAPAITLPGDVHVDITDPGAGKDAATDKAIADLKYAITALQDGFAQQSGEVPSMLYSYGTQPGLYWSKQIAEFKAADKTITGTDRFYAIDVQLKDSKSAVAYYCEDQRKSYSKNVKTEKINVTTPSNDDFYRFTLSLGLDAKSGAWKIEAETWKQGDTSCVTA